MEITLRCLIRRRPKKSQSQTLIEKLTNYGITEYDKQVKNARQRNCNN